MSFHELFIMKYLFILLFSFLVNTCKAQTNKAYRNTFAITTDNDAYLLAAKDGYYTNGLFFQFSKAFAKKNLKIIRRIEVGQELYNSRDRLSIIRQLEDADRPYCGYLFTKHTRDKFINSNQLFGYSIEAGVTGKWSLGEQFQSWYHGNIGVNNFKHWGMQIPNSFGMNVTAKYANTISSSDKQYQLFKIVPIAEATLGNFFINAKAGAYFCMGVFEKTENSVLFNARISSKKETKFLKKEFFIYAYPQLTLQVYNTTLQGDLFNQPKDTAVFTASPKVFVFQQKLGMLYATGRWQGRFEMVFQSQEATTQRNPASYIRLQIGYSY
jgi:lipid A 3-O-deacylase